MLKFEKGDQENLAGKGVIYTRTSFLKKGEFPFSAGMFFGATPPDVLDALRSYGSVPDGIEEQIRATYRDNVERFYRAQKGRGDQLEEMVDRAFNDVISETLDIPVEIEEKVAEVVKRFVAQEKEGLRKPPLKGCYTMVPLYEERRGAGIRGDVIRVTDSPEMRYMFTLLNEASDFYIASFFAQQEARMPKNRSYTSPLKNFRELSREDFKRDLFRLMGELMYCLETEDYRNHDRIFADLRQLSSGTPFITDVVNVSQIARTENPNKKRLVTLYMEKVLATVDEDFEEAGRKLHEIEQLKIRG